MPLDKKAACLEDLRKRILSQDIRPGSDLDEASLCAYYGISRTPMREIFQKLSGEGYVRLQQNRGAKVASMDMDMMRVFFQTAPMVYANIARLAAENRWPEQITQLKEIQREFSRSAGAGDAGETAIWNHRFHEQIGRMAHNPYLLPSLNRMLIDHTRLSQTFYRPASDEEKQRVAKACQQHEEMIIAIERQKPALVVELTLAHWDLSRDRLEQFVRPDPLPLDVTDMKDHRHAV